MPGKLGGNKRRVVQMSRVADHVLCFRGCDHDSGEMERGGSSYTRFFGNDDGCPDIRPGEIFHQGRKTCDFLNAIAYDDAVLRSLC
ncbi:hypothetical protein AAHA92_23476 [Salvia divinorum]|uniref:Uncharacterized protein n=1 Tax=Salvia divinorum TaxID=28513 RepID=A0ABD1GSG0_SALDI